MTDTTDELFASSPESPAATNGGYVATGERLSGPTTSRRRGRPPKRLGGRGDAPVSAMRGTFRKAYDMSLPEQRSVAHLRRIVAQRDVPDTATVTVGGDVLTIDWSD